MVSQGEKRARALRIEGIELKSLKKQGLPPRDK